MTGHWKPSGLATRGASVGHALTGSGRCPSACARQHLRHITTVFSSARTSCAAPSRRSVGLIVNPTAESLDPAKHLPSASATLKGSHPYHLLAAERTVVRTAPEGVEHELLPWNPSATWTGDRVLRWLRNHSRPQRGCRPEYALVTKQVDPSARDQVREAKQEDRRL